MIIRRSGQLIAISVLLLPPSVIAQRQPQLEIFGGYSNLQLTKQPRILLNSAGLNGWQASVKLNVTPRIGLLADFSGHYGQRTLAPYMIGSFTTPGELQQVSAYPGDVRQHTVLLGPEVRLLRRDRLTVNARALVGVAHTNTLVLPLRQPIERPAGAPSITQFSFPSASTFAASFGGSIDYRITDRLSYRVVQPELLLTRSGGRPTGNWNQYNFRLSTGLVFTAGETSFERSARPYFSFGVIGGVALTDAFGHESTGFYIAPDGNLVTVRSRSYSTLKDYVIGAVVEFRLPWPGLSVEFDALYRPMNLTMAGVLPNGSLHSISPATVVTWQFPVLAKYTFGNRPLKPFLEAGPSFRVAGNLNNAMPSVYGGTAGIGLEAQVLRLRISPALRYTHWAADSDVAGSRTKRNQAELLVGIYF